MQCLYEAYTQHTTIYPIYTTVLPPAYTLLPTAMLCTSTVCSYVCSTRIHTPMYCGATHRVYACTMHVYYLSLCVYDTLPATLGRCSILTSRPTLPAYTLYTALSV